MERMVTNEPSPNPDTAHPPTISLIAAGPDAMVPQGVPVSALRLPALEQPFVRDWLSEYGAHQVFVVAGRAMETVGTPALALPVSEDEYLAVASAMPR